MDEPQRAMEYATAGAPTHHLGTAVVEGVERIDDQIEVTPPTEPRRDRNDAHNC